MPKIGEIRHGRERESHGRHIWQACPDCGKERWIQFREKYLNRQCLSCVNKGKNNPCWKGGMSIGRSHIKIWLQPDDPFYPMADHHNYVSEPRLIVAKRLGRLLKTEEDVHHRNEIKSDNRPKNLALLFDSMHHKLGRLLEMKFKTESGRKVQKRLVNLYIKENEIKC